MLIQLYNKLKETHKEEMLLIKETKLYDAFVLLKARNDYGAKLLIVSIYVIMGKNKDALTKLKELENDKAFFKENLINEDVFYEMIGTCYFSQKNYLDASHYYLKGLHINGENFYCLYNMASIHILNKSYVKALEYLEQLKEIEPEDEIINRNIENLYKKINEEKTEAKAL